MSDTELASSVMHIALTSTSGRVSVDELQVVAAALGKQVARDLAPAWNLHATVAAFSNPRMIPHSFWRITVADDIRQPGAAGFHTDDTHNQPFSLVQYSPDWSVTASHELCEMLGDPYGNRLVGGMINGEPIRALKELCDPCEAHGYSIEGVSVSDFLLPAYYGSRPTARCSFLGSVSHPFSIVRGGYLSYLDTSGWKQLTWFSGDAPQTVAINAARPKGMSLREWIDGDTRERRSA